MTPDSDDEDLITGINIIPLVDIALVLLIVFLVTATLILSPAIRMDLPPARTAEGAPPSRLLVAIERGGALRLNGVPITESALQARLQHHAAEDPKAQVVISADRAAAHGAVIRVIDLARLGGLERFAFVVEAEP